MPKAILEQREELIGLIYDAALFPETWQAFLDKLVNCIHACSGLLILQDTGNLDIGYTIQTGFDAASRERYNRDYRTHDLWTRRLCLLPRGQVYPSRLLSQEEFHRSIIYNEYCRPLGIEHGAGAFIATEGPWSIRLALQRGQTQGEFSDSDLRHLQRLVPHIQRSVRIGREVWKFRDSFEAAIESLSTPCILLNGLRKVIAMNGRARRLLDDNHAGLVIKQDRVTIKVPALASRLETLITDSYQTATTGQGRGGGIVKLPRKNRLPLILSVMPFHSPANAGFEQSVATVALFIHDPERRRQPNTELLQELFGFTRAEARVAIALMSGQESEAIAQTLGVSKNAVKFHLKSIFAKTRTHRQCEVVSLLGGLMLDQEGNGVESNKSTSPASRVTPSAGSR